MKLILNENIRGLGSTGDIVEVKDGFGRNYLVPKKLAVAPTEMNIKRLRKAREGYLLEERGRIEAAQILAGKCADLTIEVTMKANQAGQLFGSVTEAIVAQHVTEAIGHEIHPQGVILGAHFKRIGEYVATIRLHSEVEIELPLHVTAEETEDEMEARLAAEAAAAAAEAAAEAGEEGEDGEGEASDEEAESTEKVEE